MPPLCHNVTTAGLTGIPTTAPTGSQAPTTTFAPSWAPTPLATPSPTRQSSREYDDDATTTAVLNPRVASASFVDETVWIPRGVPSVAEFAEVSGGSRRTRSPRAGARRWCRCVRARPGAARPVEAIIRRRQWPSPGPDRVHAGDLPKHTLDTLVQATAAPLA